VKVTQGHLECRC